MREQKYSMMVLKCIIVLTIFGTDYIFRNLAKQVGCIVYKVFLC